MKAEPVRHLGRGLATAAVCAMGASSMYITGGETGIGWAILGVFLIWDGK